MFVAGYIASYFIIGTCFYITVYIYEYITEFPSTEHVWTMRYVHCVCFLITASNAQY